MTDCDSALQSSPLPALKTLTLMDVQLEVSIKKTGLSPKDLELLKTQSLGVIDIYSFLLQSERPGVLLGVGGPFNMYEAVAMASGLSEWRDVYKKLGIDSRLETNHTEKFLDHLTSINEYVVFLVPPDLWTHPKGQVTKSEMTWLLNHPSRLKNVLFVFGSLEIVEEESWHKFLHTLAPQRGGPLGNQNFDEKVTHLLAGKLKGAASLYR